MAMAFSWRWNFDNIQSETKNDIQFPKFVSYKKVVSANTTKLVINNALRED